MLVFVGKTLNQKRVAPCPGDRVVEYRFKLNERCWIVLRVHGEGDAEATSIYAKAYSKDPEFYSFYRSLQAYDHSLGKDGDLLVVTPDGEFFKYLKDSDKPHPGAK